jgi:hypothetical protein
MGTGMGMADTGFLLFSHSIRAQRQSPVSLSRALVPLN